MKSNVKKIMTEQGVTVRGLIERIDELFPRTVKKERDDSKEKLKTTSLTTIMNARDDQKIESCNLRTLKMIARALGVSVHDLFTDVPAEPKDGSESTR